MCDGATEEIDERIFHRGICAFASWGESLLAMEEEFNEEKNAMKLAFWDLV